MRERPLDSCFYHENESDECPQKSDANAVTLSALGCQTQHSQAPTGGISVEFKPD